MVKQTATLAGNITVGRVSHGLMTMTLTPPPGNSDEQCFESIKAGVDALPPGAKAFLNAGEFYAWDRGTGNLEMLSRFYAKYPEYADKTFLSVKGAFQFTGEMKPNASPENIRRSVENIQRALGPIKKLDFFEPARVDRAVALEDWMGALVALVKEGKFTHVGLSECSAETLRKAHAIHPITAAEIEISPFEYGEQQKKVIATAAELGIAVLAYSPLGHGILTGTVKSSQDLHENDFRRRLERFNDENLAHNAQVAAKLTELAAKKGITVAQLSIAWVAALGPHVIPLPGSSKVNRTLENLEAGDVTLTKEEFEEISSIASQVKGTRGRPGLSEEEQFMWG